MSVKLKRVCRIFLAAMLLFLSVAAVPGWTAPAYADSVGSIVDGVWKLDPSNYTYKALQNIKELNLSGKGIRALEGLENLPKLYSLDISYNEIESLDLSTCTKLTDLNCAGNRLTSLDLSRSGRLKNLNCADNALGELDLAAVKNLQVLDCRNCGLKSLDISGIRTLTEVYCSGNEIGAIDVSPLKRLKVLVAEGTGISELDVGKNEKLVTLDCSANPGLKELNLKTNRLIKELYTDRTGITDLDLSTLGVLATAFASRVGYGYEATEETRYWKLPDGELTANPGASIRIGKEITILPAGDGIQNRSARPGYLKYKPGEFTNRLLSSTYDEMCHYFRITVGPNGSVFRKTDESWFYENGHTVVPKAGISVQSRYKETIKVLSAIRAFTVYNEDGSFRFRCTIQYMEAEDAIEIAKRLNKDHEEAPDGEDLRGYTGQVDAFVCGNALIIMEGIPSAAQEKMPTLESCIAGSPDAFLYLID